MRRRLLVLVVWVGALVVLFSSPYLLWELLPGHDLRVAVLDKTVPFEDYKEHASLMWVLDHFKVPPPQGADHWHVAWSYVGYYPSLRADGSGEAREPLHRYGLTRTLRGGCCARPTCATSICSTSPTPTGSTSGTCGQTGCSDARPTWSATIRCSEA